MAGLKSVLLCFHRRTQLPTWPSTFDCLIQSVRPKRNLHFPLSSAKKSEKLFHNCYIFQLFFSSDCVLLLFTNNLKLSHFLLQENSSAPLRPRFRTNSVRAWCQRWLWPGGPWWWSWCVGFEYTEDSYFMSSWQFKISVVKFQRRYKIM